MYKNGRKGQVTTNIYNSADHVDSVSGIREEDEGGQEGMMVMMTTTMIYDNGFRCTRRGQRCPRRNDDDTYDGDDDV